MAEEDVVRVSAIELFFDLVFVFTITQLSTLVARAATALDLVAVLLVFTVVWWHYAGYVWLTNATGADVPTRFVLVAAMVGFLVMAVAIPRLYSGGALAFGLAYLFVVVLHLGTFLVKARSDWRAVLGLAPINLGAAAFVLLAALVPTAAAWLCFLGADVLFVVSTLTRREAGFRVQASHFSERHGLVVLIALGESVIAIGLGAAAAPLDLPHLSAMTLALAANAALWWAYFAGEDERAARAFARAPPSRQPRLALVGYWYTHLVLVLGIVLLASGERRAVADPLGHAPSAAWLSAGGMALALAGTWAFRFALGVRPLAARAAAAILVLGVGAAGGVVGNAAVLALVAAIATLALAVERTRRGQAATPFK